MSKPPPAFWQDPEGDGQEVAPLADDPDEGPGSMPADPPEDDRQAPPAAR